MSKIKGFYSAVDKAAQALTRTKGTGKEFMVEVAKTKGVKPTEIQTRKLQSIADLPKMSKDEFIKELEKNPPPQLRETQIGEPTQKEVRELAEQFMHDDAVEEAGMNSRNRFETEDDVESIFEDKMYNEEQKYLDLAREHIIDQGLGTKYHDYKTEGGENYREILMRLPSDAKRNQKRMFELEAKERRSSVGRNFGNISPEEVEELNQLRELAKNPKQDYQSKHWDEPNVLAHMRVQDRIVPTYTKAQIDDIGRRMAENLGVDAKSLASGSPSIAVQRGVITPLEAAQFSHAKKFKNVDTTGATQKVLHVEEIQSDWHQEGRKKGYENPEVEARRKELEKLAWPYMEANKPIPAELKAKIDALPPIMEKGVPDAPFKKNWHELAMKRLLNYASENGYDKIAITPGAEQAKRYDLAKHINDLQYDPQTKTLTAWDHSGNKVVDRMNTSEDQLADYIGKEGAEKLLAQNPQDTHVKQLFGADLTFGGEGMKGFYDEMIPSYLNQFGKKYNVQVSPFDIEQPSATNPNNLTLPGYAPQPVPTMQFHGFDITPEMREEITTQGLPMFSKGGAVFDPEGEDYDYETAKSAGLGATGEGENEGHWGSVTMASEEDKKLHGLPDDSYMLLKGRKHETWHKAEDAEKARGSEIVKRGSRYYSIPKGYADGGVVRAAVGGQYNTQPDMGDGENIIQGTVFKRGGRVNVSKNPDTMLLDLISRN
jgi:hypothetical protein